MFKILKFALTALAANSVMFVAANYFQLDILYDIPYLGDWMSGSGAKIHAAVETCASGLADQKVEEAAGYVFDCAKEGI